MPKKSALNNFTTRIEALSQITLLENPTLQDKVYYSYQNRVCSQLSEIFSNSPSFADIQTFFAKNWAFVKGTYLSYTAHPGKELTLLLCDIAHAFSGEMYPVELLLPGISVDSLKDEYCDLSALTLQKILNSYIEGRNGEYLIPVSYLMHFIECPNPQEWINPYFDYSLHSPEYSMLDNSEYKRVGEHSPYGSIIFDALQQYKSALKESSSLLIYLKEFHDALYFNSVEGTGSETLAGEGAYDAIIQFNNYYKQLDVEVIPESIHKCITDFLELAYDPTKNIINGEVNVATCINTQRQVLKQEIKVHETALANISLSADMKQKLIEEKKQHLERAIDAFCHACKLENTQGYDKLPISLSLCQNLEIPIFIQSWQDLDVLLAFNQEDVCKLCQQPDIQAQILNQFENIESLVNFTLISPEALVHCLFEAMSEILVERFIKNYKDWRILLLNVDEATCEIIIQSAAASLQKMFTINYEFECLFVMLVPEKQKMVYSVLKNSIPSLRVADFKWIPNNLTVEDYQALFKEKEEELINSIRSITEFKVVWKKEHPLIFTLPEEQYQEFIKKTILNFPLDWSHLEELTKIDPLKTLRPYIIARVQTKDLPSWNKNLAVILEYLYPVLLEEPAPLYTRCISQMLDAKSFALLFKYLPEEKKNEIFDQKKEELCTSYISKTSHFYKVLKVLTEVQRMVVYEKIGDERLLKMLTSKNACLHQIIRVLPSEKAAAFLHKATSQQPDLLPNFSNFKVFSKWISKKVLLSWCTQSSFLQNLVQSQTDFSYCYNFFKKNQREFLYGYFNGLFSSFSDDDFTPSEILIYSRLKEIINCYEGNGDLNQFILHCDELIQEAPNNSGPFSNFLCQFHKHLNFAPKRTGGLNFFTPRSKLVESTEKAPSCGH